MITCRSGKRLSIHGYADKADAFGQSAEIDGPKEARTGIAVCAAPYPLPGGSRYADACLPHRLLRFQKIPDVPVAAGVGEQPAGGDIGDMIYTGSGDVEAEIKNSNL